MPTTPKKSKSKPQPAKKRAHHLHVVVDDTLLAKIEEHATAIDPAASLRAKKTGRAPNVSASVRDLLCYALGMPRSSTAKTAA